MCHGYFHMSIFHELEIKLQILASSISRVGQAENVKSQLQERLSSSKNMIEKEDSSHYSYSHQDEEWLRVAEAKRILDEEVLHKKLALPSSPEKGNMFKAYLRKNVHATGKGIKTLPTGEWSSYPCDSYGTRNHDEEKCRRIQYVKVNPSKYNEDHFSGQKKWGLIWRDRGTRHSALIVVRVETRLKSVGHFIYTYVWRRTWNM